MPDRFDKFTGPARHVLTLAHEEGRRFNHNYIGPEHILLGLLREGDVAGRVLADLGVDLAAARRAVEFKTGGHASISMGKIGLTPPAKKVIEYAVDEARRLNHHSIGTEHLLLGLIREGSGIAAGVLESLGVSLDRARTQTIQIIGPARGAYGHVVSEPLAVSPPVTAPLLRDLARVLPVAQTQTRGDRTVTLLALELYANGFVATFRLVEERPAEGRPPPPALSLAVADDRGNRLGALLYGATGRASEGHYEWRCAYRCIPALDRAARTLRLDLAVGRWQEGPTARADESDAEWSFTVALPADDAGAPTTEGGTDG